MRRIKIVGLAAVAVLALTALMGLSSASAAQWLDNGSAISAAENSSIVDNGSGLTWSHTGGLFGARSLKCSVMVSGTVGSGAADTSGAVTVTGCTNVSNCTSPNASSLNTPWTTSLASTTVDNITGGTGGDPGLSYSCSGLSVSCTKATTAVNVSNDTTVTPNRVDGAFTAANTSTTCSDGGTFTVTGTIWITLSNGHNLSVGP
jgi:hypothetical protein